MVHRPAWFSQDRVFVSYAETVGINKDGLDLFVVDPTTGMRTDQIDDRLSVDIDSLLEGSIAGTGRWVGSDEFTVAVPTYYDDRQMAALGDLLDLEEYSSFEARTIGDLVASGLLERRAGHGSPSADLRNGSIPYIKVSDIRAGQVNINPTNLVSEVVAKRFWRDENPGIRAFDLVTPIRSSKNIGEFAIVMPGQERVVFTKEVLVLRTTEDAPVDNFYLLWALSLKVVREQWKRVVFMQTNREDVGSRFLEIRLPWPTDPSKAMSVSQAFRDYYLGIEALRSRFVTTLDGQGIHHVFLGRPIVDENPLDDEVNGGSET